MQAERQRYVSVHRQLDWLQVQQDGYRRTREQLLARMEQLLVDAQPRLTVDTRGRSRTSSRITSQGDVDDGFEVLSVWTHGGAAAGQRHARR